MASDQVVPESLFLLQGELCIGSVGISCVAVVQPDSLSIILAAAPYHVIGEIGLCNIVCGVHNHLEDIVPWTHICDIHPLAIDVMPVGVPAAYSHSLFPKVGTCIAPLHS